MAGDAAGSAFINILPNFTGFGRGLSKGIVGPLGAAGGAAGALVHQLEGIPDTMGVAGKAVDAFTDGALRNITSLGHTMHTKLALAAETAFAGAGVRMAADLERGLREVNTLFGLTGAAAEASFGQIREDVRGLSNELGIAQTTLTDGLYQALSAGVPRDNAIDFLRIATKAAIGGVTDTATAVTGIAGTINAMGLGVGDAEAVADSLFTTVAGGSTTFDQLSNALSNVTPIAGAAGVTLQELNASIATMTSSGVPVGEATTQIRAAIQGLVRPSDDLNAIFTKAGHVNAEAAIRNKGLAHSLGLVKAASGGSQGKLMEFLGSIEAVNAAQIIAGTGAEKMAQQVAAQADSTGASGQAFEEMEKSQARSFERLRTSMQNFSIVVGEALGPAIRLLTGMVEALTGAFTALPKPLQQGLAGFIGLATALGPPAFMIWRLHAAWKALAAIKAAGAISSVGALGNAMKMAGQNTLSYRTAMVGVKALDMAGTARQMGMMSAASAGLSAGFSSALSMINPWTIALGGATLLLTAYIKEKAKANALAKEFATTLNAETGAITDQTKAKLVDKITGEDMGRSLDDLGISYEELGKVILGSKEDAHAFTGDLIKEFRGGPYEEALRDVIIKIDEMRAALQGAGEETGRKKEAAKALGITLDVLGGKVEDVSGTLEDGQKAMESYLSGALGLAGVYKDELALINDTADAAAKASGDAMRAAAKDRVDAVREGVEGEMEALKGRQSGELALLHGSAATDIIRKQHDEEIAALEKEGEAKMAAAEKAAEAEDIKADAAEKAAKRTGLTAEEATAAGKKRLAETKLYFGDLAVIAARGGGDILDQLLALGPDAAGMVDELANSSKPNFDDFVNVAKAGSADAVTAMRTQFDALPPLLNAIGATAREQLLAGLGSGKITVDVAFTKATEAKAAIDEDAAFSAATGLERPRHLVRGGNFRAGELLGVGEKGAELVRFGARGHVFPNDMLAGATAGDSAGTAGGPPTVIENLNVQNRLDSTARELAAEIGGYLAWRVRRSS